MMPLIRNLPLYSKRLLTNWTTRILSNQQVNRCSTSQIKQDAEIDEFLNDKEFLHMKGEFLKVRSF